MKRARRLTLREKKLLSKRGYDAKYFLRLKRTPERYEFLEITLGKILTILR